MTVLDEKQFELGGVVFGLGADIEVFNDGWTPDRADLTVGDQRRTTRPGVRFGKSRRGSASWGFNLFTNQETEEDAWRVLGDLEHVWTDEELLDTPDAVTPLRYNLLGRTFRVYGQPRRWTPSPSNLSLGGRIDVVADFTTVDDLVYEDEEQRQVIGLQAPPSGGGLRIPFTPPARLAPPATGKQTSITIGGTVPTPITVVIKGGVSQARVAAGNGAWVAQLVNRVLVDDEVTIDGRPWAQSATNKAGAGVKTTPRTTRIQKMWLPPGQHDIIFTGSAAESNPTATVGWRNAHRRRR